MARASVAWALVGLIGIALSSPAAGQRAGRPGIRVQFAGIDGDGTIEARAFLLVDTRRTRMVEAAVPPRAGCGGAHTTVEMHGRVLQGPVRNVVLRLSVPQPRPATPVVVASDRGCGAATITTTLADGTVITGGRYRLELTQWSPWPGGRVVGTFSQTAPRAGSPIALTGSFYLRIPRTRR